MKTRICIYVPPFPQIASYYDMVNLAAEYGLNVEIINTYELATPDIEFAKRLREYAEKKDVKFTCVSLWVDLVGNAAHKGIEKVKMYAEIAKILGSEYLHHTIATTRLNRAEADTYRPEYIKKGVAAVSEIYDYAEVLGIKTLHEPQGFIFNGVEGIKAIEAANRDTKVVADFGNIEFVDEKIEDFIPAFAEKIVQVHVKDYKRVLNGNYHETENTLKTMNESALYSCMLGEGDVDFNKGFAELKKIGYYGPVSIECTLGAAATRAMFEKNIEFLKKYIEE